MPCLSHSVLVCYLFWLSWTDALGRHHQCGTIQLDFQLPRKFGLEYTCADGSRQTPVIIHRAILGSLERFMALLLENTGGFLPFGVSPRHIAILPVSTLHATYANSIVDELRHACPDAFVEVIDATSASLGKRVRECVKSRVSLIWTVGDEEVANRSVSMRWSNSSDSTVPFRLLNITCCVALWSNFGKTGAWTFRCV
jgi:threonyl-tRNA synthetase